MNSLHFMMMECLYNENTWTWIKYKNDNRVSHLALPIHGWHKETVGPWEQRVTVHTQQWYNLSELKWEEFCTSKTWPQFHTTGV